MNNPSVDTRQAKVVIVVLLMILLFLCGLLIHQYRRIDRLDQVSSYKNMIEDIRHRKPLTATDVDILLSWMTFRYINAVFKLPNNYLKDTLHITSSHYPNLSLSTYSKSEKLDGSVFINLTKKAVSDYLISKSKF